MTDYMPGTVGTSRYGRVFRTPDGWVFDDGSVTSGLTPRDFHPLVVLDLADPKRVASGVRECADAPDSFWVDEFKPLARDLADQIEAQARPPKPAEPTGLGAVVEDDKGLLWVKVSNLRSAFRQSNGENPGLYRDYADIDAVRVLSDGVTS